MPASSGARKACAASQADASHRTAARPESEDSSEDACASTNAVSAAATANRAAASDSSCAQRRAHKRRYVPRGTHTTHAHNTLGDVYIFCPSHTSKERVRRCRRVSSSSSSSPARGRARARRPTPLRPRTARARRPPPRPRGSPHRPPTRPSPTRSVGSTCVTKPLERQDTRVLLSLLIESARQGKSHLYRVSVPCVCQNATRESALVFSGGAFGRGFVAVRRQRA